MSWRRTQHHNTQPNPGLRAVHTTEQAVPALNLCLDTVRNSNQIASFVHLTPNRPRHQNNYWAKVFGLTSVVCLCFAIHQSPKVLLTIGILQSCPVQRRMRLQSCLDHRHQMKTCSAVLLKGRKQGRSCDLGMVALQSICRPAAVL